MAATSDYPQDGAQLGGVYYPEENKDYDKDAIVAKGKKDASYPVIEDLLMWFEEQIQACDSIDAIDTSAMTINGVKIETRFGIEAQLYGQKKLKELLLFKQSEFMNYLEETK